MKITLVLSYHDFFKGGIWILLPLVRLKIDLCWKFKSPKTARTISKRNSEKASTSKPSGNPPPGDKSLEIEPDIRFYKIEYDDKAEEGEDTEILTIQDKSLVTTKQNLVKTNFPHIDTFDHTGPTVVRTMRDLPGRVFDRLEITSPLDVDKMVNYTQRFLR